MTLRVLIADDEAMARKRLERLLGALPEVQVVGVCASGEQVLASLEGCAPDVLLLDIRMPGLSGLDTSALLGEERPDVVFVTAHPEHAVSAFDVGACDYLLKPVDVERLRRTLDRVRDRRLGRAEQRVPVNTARGVRLLQRAAVTHALFDGTAVVVHSAGQRVFANGTLAELERRLGGDPFVRVHRRAVLNLDFVELLEPQPTGGFVARLRGGERIEVSRQAARNLRRRLGL